MNKKPLVLLLALSMVVSTSLSSCGTKKPTTSKTNLGNASDGPFTKYKEPVTVNIAFMGSDVTTGRSPKDTVDDNVWIRSIKEDLNIDIKVLWTVNGVDNYKTKLNLAIASNALPDIISTSNYTQFDKLLTNDKIEDLTQYYNKYAYPKFKQWYTEDGGIMKSWGTVDGKMMGISNGGVLYDSTRMVHIRHDWFVKTGLPKPKTMNDVIDIAKAFKADDPTRYGFTMDKTIIGEGEGDLVGFANAFGVYPRTWNKDASGKIIYGSIQPGMKDVLSTVADLYKDKLIDPEFAVKTGMQVAEQLTSGKVGVILGNFWLESWPLPDLYKAKNVDWDVYPLMPMASNTGDFKVQTDPTQGAMITVRKGFAHPEAAFKIMNYEASKLNDPDKADTAKFHSDDKYSYFGWGPISLELSPLKVNFDTQVNVTNAIDKNDESYLKTPHDKLQYKAVKAYVDAVAAGTKPDQNDWGMYKFFYGENSTFGVQNTYFKNNSYLSSVIAGYETPEMARKKSTLENLEDTAFIEIITGKKPLNSFDAFVAQWNELGGKTITSEVNTWYKNKK
ncbi:MAG TPA: extracellular solute-binding protein [Clostridiaceae bacterium]